MCGTRSLVSGTMVPGTWYPVPGTWYLDQVPRAWYLVLVPGAHGTRSLLPGTGLLISHNSRGGLIAGRENGLDRNAGEWVVDARGSG